MTELLASQCAHCLPAPVPDPFDSPAVQMGPRFRAAYPGECSECGDEFDEGDLIRGDGEGGYLAECCGSQP